MKLTSSKIVLPVEGSYIDSQIPRKSQIFKGRKRDRSHTKQKHTVRRKRKHSFIIFFVGHKPILRRFLGISKSKNTFYDLSWAIYTDRV